MTVGRVMTSLCQSSFPTWHKRGTRRALLSRSRSLSRLNRYLTCREIHVLDAGTSAVFEFVNLEDVALVPELNVTGCLTVFIGNVSQGTSGHGPLLKFGTPLAIAHYARLSA